MNGAVRVEVGSCCALLLLLLLVLLVFLLVLLLLTIHYLLQAHGRSFPYKGYHPGSHTNTEDVYIGRIAALAKKIHLNRPIICDASMAGQISQSRVCDALCTKK